MHVETSPAEDRDALLDRAVVEYLRAVAAGQPPERDRSRADFRKLLAEMTGGSSRSRP